jgi:hypothetical protein
MSMRYRGDSGIIITSGPQVTVEKGPGIRSVLSDAPTFKGLGALGSANRS